jgi:hypothetical protein
MEVTNMRTIAFGLTLGIGLINIGCLIAQPMATEADKNITKQPSWMLQLDIDKLNPTNPSDRPKILLLLRCEDIPRAKRIENALRYVRGEYAFAPRGDLSWDERRMHGQIIQQAVHILARLNYVDAIPLLEQKLQFWQIASRRGWESPPDVPILDLGHVRTALARLKAVRDIPEVKTSADLIEQLRRMLQYAGFNGSLEDWNRELEKELDLTYNSADIGPGPHQWLLRAYMAMLMEASWRGLDIEPAARVIQLNPEKHKPAKEEFDAVIQLSKVPRDRLAQWIVDDAMNWQVFAGAQAIKAQVLVDLGVSVLPLVWSKLEWAARHRESKDATPLGDKSTACSQIKDTGMGLVALLEVLVTLGGEQALPLIEPFTQDENKWVRHYACRAKEYIQQGKVFLFAPYF